MELLDQVEQVLVLDLPQDLLHAGKHRPDVFLGVGNEIGEVPRSWGRTGLMPSTMNWSEPL